MPLVPMPLVIGLSYIGYSYIIGDGEKFKFDMDALWYAISQNISKNPSDHLSSDVKLSDDLIQSEGLAKWRNTWCDVISAYSHIQAGRDIFVTNNTKDFQRNIEKLSDLGMHHISTPAETLAKIHEIRAGME